MRRVSVASHQKATSFQMKNLALLFFLFLGICNAQIPTTMFNQDFNGTTSNWCPYDGKNVAAQIYGYRIWNDLADWDSLQPTNTTPTYTNPDKQINTRALGGNTSNGPTSIPVGANCPGTPMNVLYTFGNTPQWASICNGQTGCLPTGDQVCAFSDNPYSCTPPSDIATDGSGTNKFFATFVNDIVTRYKGKITYYEGWNEPDAPVFWCIADGLCGGGDPLTTPNIPSLNRLVRMVWDEKNIIKCVDPNAIILSPSFHYNTAPKWFHNYNITAINAPAGVAGVNGVPAGCNWAARTVTGKMTYDYTNIHARGSDAAPPTVGGNWQPEAIITAYTAAETAIALDSLSNPGILFNDEFGYLRTTDAPNLDVQASFVARSFILCGSLGFTQCWWFQWDTSGLGPLNGNIAGTAYDTVAGWEIGSVLGSYTLTGTTYTIPITLANGLQGLIAWDTSQNCTSGCTTGNQSFGSAYVSYTDLTNTVHTTTGGNGTAPVGLKPILLLKSVVNAPTGLTVTSVE